MKPAASTTIVEMIQTRIFEAHHATRDGRTSLLGLYGTIGGVIVLLRLPLDLTYLLLDLPESLGDPPPSLPALLGRQLEPSR